MSEGAVADIPLPIIIALAEKYLNDERAFVQLVYIFLQAIIDGGEISGTDQL